MNVNLLITALSTLYIDFKSYGKISQVIENDRNYKGVYAFSISV